MKKYMFPLLPLLVLMGLSAPSQAVTISQWTFETSVPTTAGPLSPEVGNGAGTAFHANGAAVYSNPIGNGSAESWSADRWSIGDYWQFQVSTAGYQSISLSWDQISSGTGPRDFGLFWSIDGSSFTQFGSNYTVLENASPNNWTSVYKPASTFTRDLSLITALNNDASIYFRLIDRSTTSANGGSVGTSGSDRIDNFTVSGTARITSVPESAPGLAVFMFALALLILARRCGILRGPVSACPSRTDPGS